MPLDLTSFGQSQLIWFQIQILPWICDLLKRLEVNRHNQIEKENEWNRREWRAGHLDQRGLTKSWYIFCIEVEEFLAYCHDLKNYWCQYYLILSIVECI